MTIMINFSGHPVPGMEIAPLVGKNLPMESGVALEAFVAATLDELPFQEDLKSGVAAEVVLPGMAPAAGVLLALWHGRFGSFPKIRWAVRGPDGFGWPDDACADLHQLRVKARTSR